MIVLSYLGRDRGGLVAEAVVRGESEAAVGPRGFEFDPTRGKSKFWVQNQWVLATEVLFRTGFESFLF